MSQPCLLAMTALLLFSVCLEQGVSAIKLTEVPKAMDLQKFPKKNGKRIDLTAQIAEYTLFATCILDDHNMAKLNLIKESFSSADKIIDAVLRKWLKGQGRMPVQWSTYLYCLEFAGFNFLYGEMMEEMEDRPPKGAAKDIHMEPPSKKPELQDDVYPVRSKIDLFSATRDIARWIDLCTNLGVSDAMMNRLKISKEDDVTKKHECLQSYFDSGSANWNEVVTVVASPIIDKPRVACLIAKKHMNVDIKECLSYFMSTKGEL